jgi:pyruvate-formate lyase-activating enzyme
MEYSQIEFIPGQRYDMKGKRNRLVTSGEFIGMNNDKYVFKNKEMLNDKTGYRYSIPVIPGFNDMYTKTDMLDHLFNLSKNGGKR